MVEDDVTGQVQAVVEEALARGVLETQAWLGVLLVVQGDVVSVKEVVLEVDGEHLGVLVDFREVGQLLAVGAAGCEGAAWLGGVTWATLGWEMRVVLLFLVILLGSLLLLRVLLLSRLSNRSIVGSVDVVIDVAIVVPNGRLLWGKSPFIVYDELVLVDATL